MAILQSVGTRDLIPLVKKQADLEILGQYREDLITHPHLLYLFIEMTLQCNMTCRHCGSNCGTSRPSGILAKEEICSLLKEVADAYDPSGMMLCITGGEPLMRSDLFEIMGYAHSLGFSWGMTTNGTHIDQAAVERMMQTGMSTISVSLDGLREVHDWFRRKPGSFDQAVRGIQLLNKQSRFQDIQVTTVVHRKNIHQLSAIYDFVSSLHIDSWRLINIDPIGRANSCKELMLDKKDFLKLFDFIREKRTGSSGEIPVTYGCSHYLTMEYDAMCVWTAPQKEKLMV